MLFQYCVSSKVLVWLGVLPHSIMATLASRFDEGILQAARLLSGALTWKFDYSAAAIVCLRVKDGGPGLPASALHFLAVLGC